ncbi:MAG: aminoacyl-tRNA hydrolase [Pyrinomonadaceae bacterium]
MSSPRLIIGLGNPGAEYAQTRHNVGFMLIERLAEQANALVKRLNCRALIGRAEIEGERVELVKPQTYMNLSGESVACLLKKDDSPSPAQMIVISDDLALPFGKIRIRKQGSAGGHNGLKSIISCVKTEEFIRLRIGIGSSHPVGEAKSFVLEKFSKAEQKELEDILEQSTAAVRAVIRDGVEKAMAEFN